ncbi:ABC-type dipeptide/oligopeptide/nickel transport system, permease component [Halovivax ruber XH-70]|uniref:ABC-type dipeptide/oligopeptide/nickel transport system, permease component n=1 Tax=Halovivax ruber (strain DSM 18193 / JCM 13892 / XH-70) TaxID=797302 RepID=L0IAE6_HALRX|nr:ABC transporter permease [Halovivax ruber]AGB15709.1 ABC-type dipeptide/oligopeptide/nickel transport system, permease component [Halovivax ruber XH-70]
MSRWSYFLKRLLLSVPVVFLVLTFIFVMLRMGPIDPVAARLGPEATGADAQRMRENLGLTDPLWEQYTEFIGSFLSMDLGQSWVVRPGQTVTDIIVVSGPPTLWLGFWAVLLPLFIGIPLGLYSGLNPNTKGDYFATISAILWQSMPNFWLAIMIVAVLRQTHGGGWLGFDWYTFGPELQSMTGTPDLNFIAEGGAQIFGVLPSPMAINWGAIMVDIKFILPAALVLGSASMAAEARIGRTAVLENINSNYVETARAKGLKERTIVWKHIFRNALIPLVPVITSEAYVLIGGSVIIEYIFNINGLGNIFFRAMTQGDLPLAGGLLFFYTVIIIGLNVFQDFLYTIIDPRVGYER